MSDSAQSAQELAAPPAGFAPYPAISAFMGHIGPMFARLEEGGAITLALWVAAQHLNHQGAAHGGMLATLADSAMGNHAARAAGAGVATVHLGIDYLGRIQQGQWLQLRSSLDRQGKKLLFMQCLGEVDGETVLRCSAIFSRIAPMVGAAAR